MPQDQPERLSLLASEKMPEHVALTSAMEHGEKKFFLGYKDSFVEVSQRAAQLIRLSLALEKKIQEGDASEGLQDVHAEANCHKTILALLGVHSIRDIRDLTNAERQNSFEQEVRELSNARFKAVFELLFNFEVQTGQMSQDEIRKATDLIRQKAQENMDVVSNGINPEQPPQDLMKHILSPISRLSEEERSIQAPQPLVIQVAGMVEVKGNKTWAVYHSFLAWIPDKMPLDKISPKDIVCFEKEGFDGRNELGMIDRERLHPFQVTNLEEIMARTPEVSCEWRSFYYEGGTDDENQV